MNAAAATSIIPIPKPNESLDFGGAKATRAPAANVIAARRHENHLDVPSLKFSSADLDDAPAILRQGDPLGVQRRACYESLSTPCAFKTDNRSLKSWYIEIVLTPSQALAGEFPGSFDPLLRRGVQPLLIFRDWSM